LHSGRETRGGDLVSSQVAAYNDILRNRDVKLHALVPLALVLVGLTPAALAAGDVSHGKELYDSRCSGCHSIDQNRVGPAHQGVFGRRAGQAPGFGYSPAVKASRIVWSEKTLNAWLTNPEKLIPGQRMGYSVTEANDREDLIAYLKTLKGH
jgi:cytochrome c